MTVAQTDTQRGTDFLALDVRIGGAVVGEGFIEDVRDTLRTATKESLGFAEDCIFLVSGRSYSRT